MDESFLEVTDLALLRKERLDAAPVLDSWGTAGMPEPKIHRIHPYPAKFPAFLTDRALAYSKSHGLKPHLIGDIFCGCGTVAHEARRAGLEFWGCDINPVAALIARTKSSLIDPQVLIFYFDKIVAAFSHVSDVPDLDVEAISKLKRWYEEDNFKDLTVILNSINFATAGNDKYNDIFLCLFSAIVKSCSQWRSRSIKPSIDKNKVPSKPFKIFKTHFQRVMAASVEAEIFPICESNIILGDILKIVSPERRLDMILTSPPYVTSYEYADIHQLSSLWLGYTSDHRELRQGSIGSRQHSLSFKRTLKELNEVGVQVVFSLYAENARAARAVANYYLDMQQVAIRSKELLAPEGLAIFVIGNTVYHGVEIDNASHLTEALLSAGYSKVNVAKRKISNKAATPYRNKNGTFSMAETTKQTYAEEFIIVAHS